MVETVINQNDGFVSITATGGETTLAGDFPIYEKAHVTIIRTRAGVETTLVLDTDYTIADNQLEVTAGFTAVLAGSATPAVAADVYTLLLNVPEERTTDFSQAGDFKAATVNRELDLIAQQIQQLRRDTNKSASLPATSTLTSLTLPNPSANLIIGWNATANGLENKTPNTGAYLAVSSYMEPLLNSASEAALKAAINLEIGTDVQAYDADLTTLAADAELLKYSADWADVASNTTTDIGAAASRKVRITGTTTITGLGTVASGTERVVRFAGALTLTHNGTSLILPGGANIITSANDCMHAVSLGSGNWIVVDYQYAAAQVRMIQRQLTQPEAVATGTTTIPLDDTRPQIGEGDEYMTVSITPTKTTSRLEIEIKALLANSAAVTQIMALFQDATSSCLAAVCEQLTSTDDTTVLTLTFSVTAGTTSATTFRMRSGGSGAGTTTFNGVSAGRLFGSAPKSFMSVTEYSS